MLKVTKTEATETKTASVIDLGDDLDGLTKAQKKEVLDQIGELLVEQILSACADSTSPITGRAFKKLSKDYAKLKMDEVGSTDPNLDLTGEMLGSLDYHVNGDEIEIGVFGSDAPKADGHNNFSGKSNLPERRFLPGEGEKFTGDVMSLIDDTIQSYKADNMSLSRDELSKIETKSELFAYLRTEFEGLTNAEITNLILQSDLATDLDEFGLLDLL